MANKYRNVKTVVDGIRFDSKKEAARYLVLKHDQESGRITGLTCQVPFQLVVNGIKIGKYIADFEYRNQDGQRIVEDVKGVKTAIYRLKKKLVLALYGVSILET